MRTDTFLRMKTGCGQTVLRLKDASDEIPQVKCGSGAGSNDSALRTASCGSPTAEKTVHRLEGKRWRVDVSGARRRSGVRTSGRHSVGGLASDDRGLAGRKAAEWALVPVAGRGDGGRCGIA